jgi:hypothetical protein
MILFLSLLGALLAGFLHALEPDHVAAVTTFVSRQEQASPGQRSVGVVHGVAGTAPLLAVLPVTLIASGPLALSYLLLFGVGTMAGMALYAAIAGAAFRRAGERTPGLAAAIRASSGLGSAALGVLWMAIALG